MEGLENGVVDQNGAPAGESLHEMLFVEPQRMEFGKGALAGKRRKRDCQLTQCAGGKGADIRPARAGVEVFLGGGEIEKPAQVGREKDAAVRPDDQKLTACDGGRPAFEDSRGHPGAPSGEQNLAGAQPRAMRRDFIEPNQIRLGDAETAIFGEIADANELVRAGRVVT